MTITPPVADMDDGFDHTYTITTEAGMYMKTLTSCISNLTPKVRSASLCVCVHVSGDRGMRACVSRTQLGQSRLKEGNDD